MSSNPSATQLPDGKWQFKNMVSAGPMGKISAMLWIARWFYEDGDAMEYAFWEFAKEVWQLDPDEILMEKHAWSEKIINTLAHNKYSSFGGCGSSGKSHVCAAWCIFRWLANPEGTLVMTTTTSLKDADQRCWGSFIRLMAPLEGSAPFRERPSLHDFVLQEEGKKMNISRGIFLVAAEKKKTREAMGRFVGKKAKHIILFADELGELSPAIMNAGVSNLSVGGELSFQAIGCSNPDSRFDAFGEFSEPEDGWENIDTLTAMEWRTKLGGTYVRFDSEESPHYEREKSYLPTAIKIEEARENLGENSRAFMRMWRAVFFDGSEENGVYTELELAKSGALNPVPRNLLNTTIGRCAGLDLGYTWGGDRTMFRALSVGYAHDGRMVAELHEHETIKEDIHVGEPRAYQIGYAVVDLLQKYKIPARHLSVDATAGGNPICDVIDMCIRDAPPEKLDSGLRGQVTRVQFGGKPTSNKPNPRVKKRADELYKNRVTELWFASKELFRCHQIYGLDGVTAKEMTNREFDQRKTGGSLKVQLESKQDFKSRTNMPSPDAADTTFLALDSARTNFSFFPIEPLAEDAPINMRRPPMTLAQADVAGQSADSWL